MLDSFNREINYLRISITDKCNLRCKYCMPEEGIKLKKHSEILSLEQIITITATAAEMGFSKVRLTGGEPLVRKNIEFLIKGISSIKGIDFIGLTTNGQLLHEKAEKLKQSGLSRINLSLDTLDPYKYSEITRGGDLNRVLKNIKIVKKLSIPLKINMVVFTETAASEINSLRTFCLEQGLELQLINHFSLKENKKDNYNFHKPPKCSVCNRVRLLCHGVFKSCLHSEDDIPIDMSDIKVSLIKAVMGKPWQGATCSNLQMAQIGG